MPTNPLFALLGAAAGGESESAADERILAAALEQFALTGVRRTSIDDIARRAGVNRATLYRRLGAKDDIVAAAFLHEAARVLSVIESGTGELAEDPSAGEVADYIVRFFTVTLTTLRDNRLLHQLLEVDQDETLRALTIGAADVLGLASAFVGERVEMIRRRCGGSTDAGEVAALSAVLARLTQSLLLTPDGPPQVSTDAQMRVFAEAVLVPLIRG